MHTTLPIFETIGISMYIPSLIEILIFYCCPLKIFEHKKLGLDSSLGIQPF